MGLTNQGRGVKKHSCGLGQEERRQTSGGVTRKTSRCTHENRWIQSRTSVNGVKRGTKLKTMIMNGSLGGAEGERTSVDVHACAGLKTSRRGRYQDQTSEKEEWLVIVRQP